jgi:4-amino-4-deoxy-L-arabinose transferase-like glycosyltransferase
MSNTTKYSFFLIVAACFSLRAIFINHTSLWPDEALYLYISQNLMSNPLDFTDIYGNLFFENPPLFTYILSLLLRIDAFEPRVIAHFLTILMDTATVIIIFFMAKELYGTSVALISSALLSVNPLHWFTSSRILNDVPLTFFIYLALFMLIRKKEAMFYLCSILSVATKYTAAPLFLVPLVNKDRINRFPWVWLIIYVLGISAAIFLITRQIKTQHEWLNYFIGAFKIPDFHEMYREVKYFLGLIVCFFFFIGFATALKKKDFSPLLAWVILFGTARLFLPWMAFRVSRYTLPLYPAIIIFAAYGGTTSFRFLQRRLSGRTLFLSLVFGSIFLYVLATSSYRGYTATYHTSKKAVGFETVREFFDNRPQNVIVLTSSPRQVKYMVPELTVYDLAADTTPEEASHFITEKGVNYVIMDRWSPHQPGWVLSYFSPKNGYHPVHATKDLVILAVGRHP